MGPSGSGKTTLLNLIGGESTARTSGDITVAGTNIGRGSRATSSRAGGRNAIGYIFQLYNLMPRAHRAAERRAAAAAHEDERRRSAASATFALELVGSATVSATTRASCRRPARRDRARARDAGVARRRTDRRLDRKVGRGSAAASPSGSTPSSKKTIVMVTHDPHAAERAPTAWCTSTRACCPPERAERHAPARSSTCSQLLRSALTLGSVLVALFLYSSLGAVLDLAAGDRGFRQPRAAARHAPRDRAHELPPRLRPHPRGFPA